MASLVMHRALWLLLRLSIRARVRSLLKLTKTWKGRFLLLMILGAVVLWMVGTLVGTDGAGRFSPGTVRNLGAMGLATMLLATILFGNSEGGIVFSPAEVEFLFPSPISRRHLMVYRIVLLMLVTFPTSIFIGTTFQRNTPTFIGAWLGAWLSFSVMSLTQMAWQLAAGILAQTTVARSRKVLVISTLVALGAAVATGAFGTRLSVTNIANFADSRIGEAALAPFLPFSSVLAAANLREVASNAAVCLAIMSGLILLILKLDRNHTEASFGASQRMAKMMEDAKRGRVGFSTANGFMQRFSVPLLPRLRGAGPIAWHQLTALLRSAGNLAFFIILLGGLMMAPVAMSETVVLRQVVAVMIAMSVFLLPQFVQYDFRAEVERMPVLKSLPLNPIAIVCGELLAPVLVTLFIQLVMIVVMACMGGTDIKFVLLVAAFLIPANFLIYMAENLVFLMFPYRIGLNNGQDLQTMIRVMLTMFLKLALIGAMAGAAAGLGGLVYYFSNAELPAFAVAWVTVVACCAGLLPALAWAFNKFDPASDTPD